MQLVKDVDRSMAMYKHGMFEFLCDRAINDSYTFQPSFQVHKNRTGNIPILFSNNAVGT